MAACSIHGTLRPLGAPGQGPYPHLGIRAALRAAVIETLRAAGLTVTEDPDTSTLMVLDPHARASPTVHSENVNFFSVIDVDVEGELAELDGDGFRPLRAPARAAVRGVSVRTFRWLPG